MALEHRTVSAIIKRGSRGAEAHPARAPAKIGKNMIFCAKSWFFTRNTQKIFAPSSARRDFFFKCAPLTWNPGSEPDNGDDEIWPSENKGNNEITEHRAIFQIHRYNNIDLKHGISVHLMAVHQWYIIHLLHAGEGNMTIYSPKSIIFPEGIARG